MRRVLKSNYARNVFTLMTGTTIAQIIPLLITPVLSRMFTPEDFGVFAMYTSILYILSVLMCGRYEYAILLPKTNREAFMLVVLCAVIAGFVGLLTLVFVVLLGPWLARQVNMPAIASWLWFLPLSLFVMAILQSFGYYCNRNEKYRDISASRIYRSVFTSILSLAGGWIKFKPGGLITGDLVGQSLAAGYLVRRVKKNDPEVFNNIQSEEVKRMGRRYINFPKFQILSGLLEKSAGQAPVFLLANFFTSQTVGFFSLSQRIIISPSSLISGAMGDVFRQQASVAFLKDGNARHVFARTLRRLFLISIIPFTIGFFVIEDAFTIFLGKDWTVAGEYAKIMMPMFFLQFIVSPLSVMFVVAEKQKYDLVMQIFLFTGCCLAFIVSHKLGWDAGDAIRLFAAVYCVKYLVEFFLAYRFAKGNLIISEIQK